MIGKCSHCGREKELEKWGGSAFCDNCVELYKKKYKKPGRGGGIELARPAYGIRASYHPGSGNALIRSMSDDINVCVVVVSHEFIHYLLHKNIGLKCCYLYDNISPHGELVNYSLLDPKGEDKDE